jgi:hypothetical protein
VLNSAEDRVQGLSGNNMIYFEESEDILSEGAQGSRSNHPVIKGKHGGGSALCFTSKNQVYENINTEGVVDGSVEDDQNRRESTGEGKGGEMVPYVEVARKEEGSRCVMAIYEHQKIPDTRQSSRVQDQIMKKYNINSQGETKKRAHEGNISNNHNSFAILSNHEISALFGCMCVSILPD